MITSLWQLQKRCESSNATDVGRSIKEETMPTTKTKPDKTPDLSSFNAWQAELASHLLDWEEVQVPKEEIDAHVETDRRRTGNETHPALGLRPGRRVSAAAAQAWALSGSTKTRRSAVSAVSISPRSMAERSVLQGTPHCSQAVAIRTYFRRFFACFLGMG